MRPTSRDLAMRDPAKAALMGALPGRNFGADVRRMQRPSSDFGVGPFGFGTGTFGGLSPYDPSLNIGFGWDYGADAAPMAPPAAAMRSPAAAHAALSAANLAAQHTAARESLLDPNRHSQTKVERYSFSITNALVLNVASALANMSLQPSTAIRPQRVVMNAPTPNFVLLSSMQIANVNVFVGQTEDAFTYSATAMGVMLDLPTLDPSYRATIQGNYTGFVPPGYANNFGYTFIVSFQGPALIAGGK